MVRLPKSKASFPVVEFGSFTLDLTNGELCDSGRSIKLHPQPAQLLSLLVSRAGGLVTREEIQKELWSDETFVDYNLGINSCIRQLRTALGEQADEPRFIETIPKQGYRFVVVPLPRTEKAEKRDRRRTRIGLAAIAGMVIVAGMVWRFLRPEPEATSPQIKPFTSTPGVEWDPAISPDGDQVAFVWKGHLHIQLIDGEQPLQLTRADGVHDPTWSPDGRRIAFLRDIHKEGEKGRSDVLLISALGGQESRIGTVWTTTELGPYYRPGLSWSPDGRHLAVADKEPTEQYEGISLLSIESGEKTRLTAPPPGTSFRDMKPRFSPDGRYVAFIRKHHIQESHIYLQAVDGGEPELLIAKNLIFDLAWAQDGSTIVFSQREESGIRLWRFSVADGSLSPLPFGEMGREISIRGDHLVFSRVYRSACNIWQMGGPAAKEIRTPKKLITSSGMDFAQEISPDGTKIAFLSSRSEGFHAVWTCDINGTNCTRMTEPSCGHPRWSPDGNKIAYQTDDGAIYVVSAEGGPAKRLADPSRGFFPSWSRDGKWIDFASERSGDAQIFRMPAEGGTGRQITRNGGFDSQESSDGRFLYYLRRRPDASYKWGDIYRVPVEGGEEVPVLEGKLLEQWNWTLWKDKIIYRHWTNKNGAQSSPCLVSQKDLKSGEDTELSKLEGGIYGFGLTVSPDGGLLLFSRLGHPNVDLILVENFR